MISELNFPFVFKEKPNIDDVFVDKNIKYEFNKIKKLTVYILGTFLFIAYLIIAHGYWTANYYFLMDVTSFSLILLILLFILKRNMYQSEILTAITLIYVPIANILIKDAFFLIQGNPSINTIFLHTHFMLLLFVCLCGLVCNLRHILFIGALSVIWIWIFTFYSKDSFLWSLVTLDSVFFIGVSVIIYSVYSSIRFHSQRLDELSQNKTIQNEKLNKLIDFKDWMLNIIMHDLKNPINRILCAGKKPVIQQEEVVEPGKEMLLLVQNILDVYKMEESKMKLKLSTVYFDPIIQQATDQVKYLLDERKITLIKRISVKSTVEADEHLLVRVIINLLSNAIKYSQANSCIEIRIMPKDDKIRVEVIDHGEGIDLWNLDAIFEKYFQGNTRDLGYNHSTGLGLSFCKSVIAMHGGVIGAQSVLNKGTTIWFELPVQSENTEISEIVTQTSPRKYMNNQNENLTILKYKMKMANLVVYQTGEILKILKSSTYEMSPDFLFWKEEIIKSSMTGNVEYFNQLKEIPSDSNSS